MNKLIQLKAEAGELSMFDEKRYKSLKKIAESELLSVSLLFELIVP